MEFLEARAAEVAVAPAPSAGASRAAHARAVRQQRQSAASESVATISSSICNVDKFRSIGSALQKKLFFAVAADADPKQQQQPL